ncbi:hypothetical protein [Butyrivibrio sp. XB500-5]|uniref:hypothetical protein n=1 Tax=Butyrivibrio sp. XB500-5 TaxID=2364880 RepID=UPI0011C21F21|nr:hypothetical protein [Butyrivibrio sp. XB500-5]
MIVRLETSLSVDEEIRELNNEEDIEKKHDKYNRIVEFSVLTKEIYDYDRETILNEFTDQIPEWTGDYHPFFVSFFVEVNENSKHIIDSLEYQWYKARFIPNNPREAINNELIQDVTTEESSLDAMLFFSANSVKNRYGKLQILSDEPFFRKVKPNRFVLNHYKPDHFPVASDGAVGGTLNGIWNDDAIKKVDLYNIGHGNADYIKGKKKRLLFDIGYDRNNLYRYYLGIGSYPYPKARRAINRMKPSAVIVSHWDTDHFMGYIFANPRILDLQWVAPTLVHPGKDMKFSISAFRLAAFLIHKGNLLLVNRTGIQHNVATLSCGGSNYLIQLKMGGDSGLPQDISKPGITLRNREGLYLEFFYKNKLHTLLGADVPYNSMERTIDLSQLMLMHVPHHCSNMRLMQLTGRTLRNKKDAYAIICTSVKDDGGVKIYEDYFAHRNELDRMFGHDNVWHTLFPKHNINRNRLIRVKYDDYGNIIVSDYV